MNPEYKQAKEEFVSHFSGGGIWEINLVTLVAPAAALLWAILQARQGFFKPYTIPAAVTDFLLQCCAILFAVTVYSSSPQALLGLLILPVVATLLQSPNKSPEAAKPPHWLPEANGNPAETKEESSAIGLDPLPAKPFISTYRGAMMIVTCASILAVDFPVFPRRFAKTERFGTSLMDMGVGSFVFAGGIVAARQQLKEELSGLPSLFERMKMAMRHSLPLLVLGFIRLWSVKGLDYAEHVSEYGVHWNFFFTLGLLPPAIALLQPVLRFSVSYGLLAFILSIIQELILYMIPDIKVYILLSERIPGDWLSQNREGVYSFLGYLAIFIGGMGVGTGILPRDPEPEPKPTAIIPEKDPMDEDAEWLASILGHDPAKTEEKAPDQPRSMPGLPKTALVHLAKWTVIWFVLCVWAMWDYGPHLYVSRRMANLAYIVWVCAFNTAQLCLFCAIETVLFPSLFKAKDKQTERQRINDATSRVMRAFNRNGLPLFLLANLLTGGINMSMETISMGDVPAMVVLVAYMGVICSTALLLDAYDVSIRL